MVAGDVEDNNNTSSGSDEGWTLNLNALKLDIAKNVRIHSSSFLPRKRIGLFFFCKAADLSSGFMTAWAMLEKHLDPFIDPSVHRIERTQKTVQCSAKKTL